jgi:hypothetical protein
VQTLLRSITLSCVEFLSDRGRGRSLDIVDNVIGSMVDARDFRMVWLIVWPYSSMSSRDSCKELSYLLGNLTALRQIDE